LLHEAIINPQALFGESFMIRLQLENKARELHERLVRSFMDLIILRELGKGEALGGYDVISLINKRFHVLISPGTVYSLLYSMERKGLIKDELKGRGRVFKLTEKGREKLENIQKNSDKIILFIKSILDS